MPVYEFKCTSCGSEFSELFHSTDVDVAAVECPACQSHASERLLSVFAAETGASSVSESGGRPCGPGCGCHQ